MARALQETIGLSSISAKSLEVKLRKSEMRPGRARRRRGSPSQRNRSSGGGQVVADFDPSSLT